MRERVKEEKSESERASAWEIGSKVRDHGSNEVGIGNRGRFITNPGRFL